MDAGALVWLQLEPCWHIGVGLFPPSHHLQLWHERILKLRVDRTQQTVDHIWCMHVTRKIFTYQITIIRSRPSSIGSKRMHLETTRRLVGETTKENFESLWILLGLIGSISWNSFANGDLQITWYCCYWETSHAGA